MMSKGHVHRDPILVDAEEYEAAILEVLDVIGGGDVREKLDAFRRFARIFSKTGDWTYEQKVQASRYLAKRGRIEHTDWEDVIKAMERFDTQEMQQNPGGDRGNSSERRPVNAALH
jgi:hypothetical protein